MSYITISLIVIGALFLIVVFIYNRLVALTNRKNEAWSDIDIQLKRRYNLIPNLIETVKGYVKHEREVLEKVTEMRANAINTEGVADQGKAENMLSEALKSLFAVSENYPDLKANQNFIELQKEITDTENKIQAARRFYNSTVQDLMTAVQSFPQNIIAKQFKFEGGEFFEVEEDEKDKVKDPVKVKF